MTALLSNWRSTSVSVFYMKTLKVVWTTRKKSPHFDERSKGDESAQSGTISFYNELKGPSGEPLCREKHGAH